MPQASRLARAVGAEEETGEELRAVLLPRCDAVQVPLHGGREVVVHQVRQVLLEQAGHGERQPRGDQVLAAVRHVAAVADRLDGGRVGGGAPDAELLHGLHQRGLRVAPRGLRLVPVGRRPGEGGGVALGDVGQGLLRVGVRLLRVVAALVAPLLVGEAEARRGDHRARGGGHHAVALAVDVDAREHADRRRVPARIGHLGGDRALPDQVVQGQLLLGQGRGHLARRAEVVPGGTDRLVGLLRALRRRPVRARGLGHGLGSVELGGLLACGVDGLPRQRRGVGAHVRDVAGLVEGLGGAHGRRRVPVQFARGLLLQGGGREGGGRAAPVRLAGHGVDDRGRGVSQRLRVGAGRGLVQVEDAGLDGFGAQPALLAEVRARRDRRPVDGGHAGTEGLTGAGEGGVDRPVLGAHVGHAVALAVDDQARRHRLDAAGRQGGPDLAPQQGGDLVAVEAVEDAARLLRVHQVRVQVARVVEGPLDGLLRDLVEHHAPDGDLGLEDLQQVPGDGLPLAVLISGQVELVGLLEEPAQFRDLLLLVGVDHVVGLEPVLDVDGEAPVGALLHGVGEFLGLGQVADVPDGGRHMVVGAQVALNRLGFRGGLHDHQLARRHARPSVRSGWVVVRGGWL